MSTRNIVEKEQPKRARMMDVFLFQVLTGEEQVCFKGRRYLQEGGFTQITPDLFNGRSKDAQKSLHPETMHRRCTGAK